MPKKHKKGPKPHKKNKPQQESNKKKKQKEASSSESSDAEEETTTTIPSSEASDSSSKNTPTPTVPNSSYTLLRNEQGFVCTMKGLANVGNTCFFNSTLQCLTHCKELIDYYLFYKNGKVTQKDVLVGPLNLSFIAFLKQMYCDTQEKSVVTPKPLLQQLILKTKRFRGYQQQDAHELLRYLENGLKDEVYDSLKKKMADQPIDTTKFNLFNFPNIFDDIFRTDMRSTVLCHHCHNVSVQQECSLDISAPIPHHSTTETISTDSLISKFEYLQVQESNIHAKSPRDILNPSEIMNYLKQEMQNESSISIISCLWGYFRLETLTGENRYLCEKCSHEKSNEDDTKNEETTNVTTTEIFTKEEKEDDEDEFASQTSAATTSSADDKQVTLRDASKQLSIMKPPPILTVHLKRFIRSSKYKSNSLNMFLSGGFVKNNAQVQIVETLNLNPFIHPESTYKNESNLYQLFGIVEHMGSISSGHYVAYVKQLFWNEKTQDYQRGDWYHISDSHCAKVDREEVMRCQPYILFYEKIEQKQEQQETAVTSKL